MLTEAMQGVGVFAAVAIPGSYAMWKWMQSDAKPPKRPRNLGDGFVDMTIRRERWDAALSPKEAARLRQGVR